MLELFGFLCCCYLLYKYIEHTDHTDHTPKLPRAKPSDKSAPTSKR